MTEVKAKLVLNVCGATLSSSSKKMLLKNLEEYNMVMVINNKQKMNIEIKLEPAKPEDAKLLQRLKDALFDLNIPATTLGSGEICLVVDLKIASSVSERLKDAELIVLSKNIEDILDLYQPYLDFSTYNDHLIINYIVPIKNPHIDYYTEVYHCLRTDAGRNGFIINKNNQINLYDKDGSLHEREKLETFIKELGYKYNENGLNDVLNEVYVSFHYNH